MANEGRRPRRFGLIVALLAVVGLTAAGIGAARLFNAPLPPIDADDAVQVAQGQGIYAAHCASCHGAALEGQPNWRERLANGRLPAPPHDASGHSWHHPDSQLFGITKHGMGPYAPEGYESDMLAFEEKLTDREIAAAIAYIKSTWPADIRQRQQRINQQERAAGGLAFPW